MTGMPGWPPVAVMLPGQLESILRPAILKVL